MTTPDQPAPPIRCHVVEGMPADLVLVTSPRRDPDCRERRCDHTHEVAIRVDEGQREQYAAAMPPPLFKVSIDTEQELAERFKAIMATPGRIEVLPPTESEREQAAFERGVAEGRRQATEGGGREWGVRMEWLDGPMTTNCGGDRDVAEDYIAALWPSHRSVAKLVSRLVGPWEPTEQADGGAR